MAKGLVWLQTNGSIMTIILTSITLFIKRRGVYLIFRVSYAAFIRGRRLFQNHFS